MVGALTFRNTYASQPYLPDELIPVDHKKVVTSNYFSLLNLYLSWKCTSSLLSIPQRLFSIGLDVKWPELSSCIGEFGCCGEIIIRSEDGQAVLILGPSGEDFSVRYTCSLSGSQYQNHSTQAGNREPEKNPGAQQPGNALICQSAAAAATADDTHDGQLESRNIKFIRLMTRTVQPKVRVLKFLFF